eukprot:CAMPEP_0198280164 /NCGR_PEP_ID=MMETSP1449-20131203/294_1 /TAXON_ID=420275 /ORGANISM="Attheya septentrionalis, Strain CCMP2084" /LENGTH=607 /DNA_ID=CAMNT_0043975447 /DNA_START=794 /DNA_END=2617 /DNA_ORIENTATION=-
MKSISYSKRSPRTSAGLRTILLIYFFALGIILLPNLPGVDGRDITEILPNRAEPITKDLTNIMDSSDSLAYDRQHHRALGSYVFIEVSGEFSSFGKWSVFGFYALFWFFIMFPNTFFCVNHQPTIALCGGIVMMAWRLYLETYEYGPHFAVERAVILEPLLLLFGSSLILTIINKKRSNIQDRLCDFIQRPWGESGPVWRCIKLIAIPTVLSTILTNDGAATLLSSTALKVSPSSNSGSRIYGTMLAVCLNCGAILTYTGSLHNMMIVTLAYDKIGWIEFLSNMALPFCFVAVIYSIFLSCFMRNSGADTQAPFATATAHAYEGLPHNALNREEVVTTSLEKVEDPPTHEEATATATATTTTTQVERWSFGQIMQGVVLSMCIYLFALGFDVIFTSIGGGTILLLLASCQHRYLDEVESEDDGLGTQTITQDQLQQQRKPFDAETVLANVDYSRIIFFVGQFIMVGSLNDTGIPQAFFNVGLGNCADQMTSGSCVYKFVTMIALLSNVVSSTSACLMVAATFPYASPYDWVVVAFAVTIAGNFLGWTGSTSNAIIFTELGGVSPKTRFLFGIPSALLCLYLGTFILNNFHFSPECSVKLGTCNGHYN